MQQSAVISTGDESGTSPGRRDPHAEQDSLIRPTFFPHPGQVQHSRTWRRIHFFDCTNALRINRSI